jgi:hypothetical protein
VRISFVVGGTGTLVGTLDVNINLLAVSFNTFDVGAGFVAKSVGLLEMGSRLFKSVV